VDFQTQFADGYNYSITPPAYVSTFMAPAYSNLALGISYKVNDNYSFFLSPITLRTTIVLDNMLANAGAYGMKNGNNFLFEPGAYFVARGQQKIMENVVLASRLDLFTPYNKDFGKIDVNWDLSANCHINKFLTATVSTTLRYFEREIRKIQFRQTFSLGLSYTFATR
jgi:long-subunit fatty acid transport protein